MTLYLSTESFEHRTSPPAVIIPYREAKNKRALCSLGGRSFGGEFMSQGEGQRIPSIGSGQAVGLADRMIEEKSANPAHPRSDVAR